MPPEITRLPVRTSRRYLNVKPTLYRSDRPPLEKKACAGLAINGQMNLFMADHRFLAFQSGL
jgi:hypothetical protein